MVNEQFTGRIDKLLAVVYGNRFALAAEPYSVRYRENRKKYEYTICWKTKVCVSVPDGF